MTTQSSPPFIHLKTAAPSTMFFKIFTLCLQPSRPSTSSESPEIFSRDELRESKKSASGSKLADRAKKRAWYNNLLYPSYKSRAEECKKLFNLSEDERLVVGELSDELITVDCRINHS
jgi:hypothetical protein